MPQPPTRLEALLFHDFAPVGDPAALRLRGAPTISKAKFAEVLQGAGSPVLQEAPADTYYDLIVSYGMDPAVALAFFALESGEATARWRKSGGAAQLGHALEPADRRMGPLPDLAGGAGHWLRRVQGPRLPEERRADSGESVKVYQPSGLKRFNNDTTLYSDAASTLIASWQA